MNTLSYLFNRLAVWLSSASSWLLVIIGAAMSVIVFLQVVFRFVIYVPFPWSEEIARYLMIWMGMLGSVVALNKGRHIGVTVIVERLPPKVYALLIPVIQLIMVFFLLVIFKEGLSMAVFNASQRSPAMEIPMFYPYLAIPAGAALMIVEMIADILHRFFPTEAGSRRGVSSAML
jgi:C4-dicarboxylate transporter DctQ subunit